MYHIFFFFPFLPFPFPSFFYPSSFPLLEESVYTNVDYIVKYKKKKKERKKKKKHTQIRLTTTHSELLLLSCTPHNPTSLPISS